MAACEHCGNAGYLNVRKGDGSFHRIPCPACTPEVTKMAVENKDLNKTLSGSFKSTGKLLLDETLDAAKLELAARAADGLHAAAKAGYRRIFGRDWPVLLDAGPGAAAVKVLVPAVLRTAAEMYGDSLPYASTVKNVSDLALRGVTRQAVKETVQLAMPFLVDIVALGTGLMAAGATTVAGLNANLDDRG